MPQQTQPTTGSDRSALHGISLSEHRPFVTREMLLQAGLLASMLASGFLLSAVLVGIIEWSIRYFDVELTERNS